MGRWGCVWQKGGCGHRGEGGWAQGRLREGADRGVSAPAGRMAQVGWSSGQGEGAGPPHDPRLDLKDAQPDVALSSPFIFIFTLETSRVIRYNFYTMLKAHQRSVRDPGRRGRGSNIWLTTRGGEDSPVVPLGGSLRVLDAKGCLLGMSVYLEDLGGLFL